MIGRGNDTPQPVSGPMSREVADWYIGYTDGQVEAFEHGGRWYLYMPEWRDGSGVSPGVGRGSVGGREPPTSG